MVVCKNDDDGKDMDTMLKITKCLLENGALVNIRDRIGRTPLIYACMNGNKEIVELLIGLSALDAFDNFGSTVYDFQMMYICFYIVYGLKLQAIIHAVGNGHIEIVKILIEAGVDVKIKNNDGYRPRQVAANNGFYDIEELFEEEAKNEIPILGYQTYHDLVPTIFPERKRLIYRALINLKLESYKV